MLKEERRPRRRLLRHAWVIALVALVAWGAARRFIVVDEYRNFAGDGWQYFHLAETLVKDGRYAFGHALPPATSRLPGYPLFVAALGWSRLPAFLANDVGVSVARGQAVLDVLTALMMLLLVREIGLKVPGWMAVALCLASPFLTMCVSYVLSETLAVFLHATIYWLLLRACRVDEQRPRRLTLLLGIAGGVVALGVLVRADTLAVLPCFLVPLWHARVGRDVKLEAALSAAVVALVIFLPWPVRNQIAVGRPHALGGQWLSKQGDEMATGVQAWLGSWASQAEQATVTVAWRMTRGDMVFPGTLPPEAWDSEAEKTEVYKIFDHYNRNGLIPPVDDEFRKLALERRARAPLRSYVVLPLLRVGQLWGRAVPEWEMPFTSTTLRLPAQRGDLDKLNTRTLVLALIGLAILFAYRRGRPLAQLFVIIAVTRTGLVVWLVPGGTQRYLFELLPLMLVLAAVALTAPAELILRHRLAAAAAPASAAAPAARRRPSAVLPAP